MGEEQVIKEVQGRLCSHCKWQRAHQFHTPLGYTEDGAIIYENQFSTCRLKPITEDGKDCPYFSPTNGEGE